MAINKNNENKKTRPQLIFSEHLFISLNHIYKAEKKIKTLRMSYSIATLISKVGIDNALPQDVPNCAES